MTTSLHTLTTPVRLGQDSFRWDVPEGWLQGRGVFGGLVTGTLVRAAEAFVDDPSKPLRSLTAHLCGPTVPGEALVRVGLLREGSNIRTVTVEIVQQDAVQVHAVALFASARSQDADGDGTERPQMPSWRELEPAPIEPPLAPQFATNFEFRVAEGFPFSGETDLRAGGWIRPKQPGPVRDAAYLASLIDAWWPVALHGMTSPRPVGTVTFTLEIVGDQDGLDPQAPLFHTARQVAGRDGYLVEFRELRGEDGRLLALNQQTIALIR